MTRKIQLFTVLLGALFASQIARGAAVCNNVANNVNLISNCGFERGAFGAWKDSAKNPYDYVVDSTASPYPAYEGQYFAAIGGDHMYEDLGQTFTTVAGGAYQIIFAVADNGGPAEGLRVYFDGTLVTAALSPTPTDSYFLYTLIAYASDTNGSLVFSAKNNQGYYSLDSVSVQQVPTPEPGSFLLLGTGALGIAGAARRRFKR